MEIRQQNEKGGDEYMTCFYCKGSTNLKLKTHAVTLEECVIIVKNVPALVCGQCGEAYFSDEVMEKLEVIVDKLEKIIKEVAIVDYTDEVA
jgi:YgiT-type zinc finger domain-containing protein